MLFSTVAFAVASALPAQPAIDPPRLFPAGARAPGVPDVRYDAGQDAYLFALRDVGGHALVEYRLPLGHPYVQRGVLRVEEATTGVVPIDAGGFFYRTSGVPASGLGRLILPYDLAFGAAHDPNHDGALLSHGLDPGSRAVTLRMRDTYRAGAATFVSEKTFTLRLYGRCLQVTAQSDPAVRIAADFNHAGFYFGDGDALPSGGRALHVPYMDMVPVFVSQGVYVTRFLDWNESRGSDTPATEPLVAGVRFRGETSAATYRSSSGQLNAPIHEVAYVVVARTIADLFPVIDRPPSEYRLLCAERAVSQNGPGNRYDHAGAWVSRASACAVDDMGHIKWDWHKWPFNLNDPDYIPAAPAPAFGVVWGTPSQWLSFTANAARAGWGLAPYVAANMMDAGYPNLTLQLPGSTVGSVLLTANPAYDATLCTRDAALAFKKGWDTNLNLAGTNLAGQGHPVDVQSPHSYVAKFAAIAGAVRGANGFATGGAHVDAQTEVPAWIEIDQVAGSALPKTIAENLRHREAAFQTLKDGFEGPLFGENSHWRYRAFETFAAGVLDGTSRKIPIHWSPAQGPPDAPNWDAAVIPDFELGVVAAKATGFFGMGWEYQYRPSGYPVAQAWSDGWHTTLLSYGHAPFFSTNGDVPNNYWNWRDTLRSYHLTRGLSAALRRGPLHEVRYEGAGGSELTLDQALAAGLDLAHPRLIVRTASGVELKANHSATDWVTPVLGVAHTIPTDGFAGAGPGGLLAVAVVNPASGQRVDYAFDPGVCEMIDRRGIAQSYRGFPGALLPVPPGVLPPGTDETQLVIVRDVRRNQAVYASGFVTGRQPLGPAPVVVALRIDADDTTTLSLGRLRLGLRAIAIDSNGHERDVSALVRWTSSATSIASVGRLGAVAARGAGSAVVTAEWTPSLAATRGVDVTVVPIVSATTVEANTRRATMVRFLTDTACPLAALLVEQIGGGYLPVAWATADPASKLHRTTLSGLTSGLSYRLTPAAMNAFGLVGVGPPVVVTVP